MKCRTKGCERVVASNGLCRRCHEEEASGLKSDAKSYRPRGDDTVSLQGLRVRARTAEALKAAADWRGWSVRAVISAVLDAWAEGWVWRVPRPAVTLGGLALALVLASGWVGTTCTANRPPHQQPQQLDPTPEEAYTASVGEQQEAGKPGRRVIPKKPADWQKVPPCDAEVGEEAIQGACYLRLARNPPCGRLIEHEGSCLRAVAKPEKVPVSIESSEPR
jgi:hypothetical protein